MSLDLLKNTLFQAIRDGIPGLKVYAEHVDTQNQAYPNLSFVDVATRNLDAKPGWENFIVANPDTSDGAAPWLTWRVIAHKMTRLRMQLRDNPGKTRDAAAIQRMRALHNRVDRLLTNTRAVTIQGATDVSTFAELWYEGDRQAYDKSTGVSLSEYELRIDPWRLLDADGLPTFGADEITVDIKNTAGTILITRIYPQS